MRAPRLADWGPTPETPAGCPHLKPGVGVHWEQRLAAPRTCPRWQTGSPQDSVPKQRTCWPHTTQAQSTRSADQQHGCFGPELHSSRVRGFGPVGGAASLCSWYSPTHRRFQVWVPFWCLRCGRPAGVSVVGPQSADLGAGNWASGEPLGCLSRLRSPGVEGGGAPGAMAAAQSSLTSP